MAALGRPDREIVIGRVKRRVNGTPQLSIIIVNHRADGMMRECLTALAGRTDTLSSEIIMVDNPPGNAATPDEEEGVAVVRVPAPKRLGFAAAANLGAAHSRGEFLLFLNPDVIVDATAVGALHAALTGHPAAGIAVARLTGPDGSFQPCCRRFPTIGRLLFSRGSILYRLFRLQSSSYTLPDYAHVTEVDAAAAACLMISRVRFEALDGFDASFFMYMEDTDLCYRLTQQGEKTVFVPQASARHYWGYSTRHYRFQRILWHHRSLWRYIIKHNRSLPILMVVGPALLVNCLLSLLTEMVTFRK